MTGGSAAAASSSFVMSKCSTNGRTLTVTV